MLGVSFRTSQYPSAGLSDPQVLGVSLRTSQYPSAGPSDPQVPLLSLVMLESLTGKRRPILAETRQTGSAKG